MLGEHEHHVKLFANEFYPIREANDVFHTCKMILPIRVANEVLFLVILFYFIFFFMSEKK